MSEVIGSLIIETDIKTAKAKASFEKLTAEILHQSRVVNELSAKYKELQTVAEMEVKSKGFISQETSAEIVKTEDDLRRAQASLNVTKANADAAYKKLKQLENPASDFNKNIGSANTKLKKGISTLLKYAFGIRTLFALVRKLTGAIKDGFNNVTRFDNAINASASRISSSMKTFKNALGAAVSPIASIVEPAITRLLKLLTNAANVVAMLAAKLTGAKTYTKAIAFQEDYAASLNNSASAAEELKTQLSGLDEMNTWQDNKGTGADGAGAPISQMFETASVDENFTLSDWLNQAIENFDPVASAKRLSEKIINVLKKAGDLVGRVDWMQLGEKIATWIANIDWGNILASLLETLVTFDISLITGVIKFTKGFLSSAFKGIADYFEKWIEELGGDVAGGLLCGILAGLHYIGKWIYDYVFTPIINAIKKAFGIHSPAKATQEIGEYIVQGLLNGLISAPKRVKAIIDQTKEQIIAAFKGAPSRFTANLTEIWESVKKWYVSNVKPKFLKDFWLKKFSTVGDGLKQAIKNGINAAISVMNKFIGWVNDKLSITVGDSNLAKFIGINPATYQLLTIKNIPMLAKGAVIPANHEFMAVLGDQKNGRNLEAPEDLIRKIVREESGSGTYVFQAMLDGRVIFEETVSQAKMRQRMTGKNPFKLGAV